MSKAVASASELLPTKETREISQGEFRGGNIDVSAVSHLKPGERIHEDL